MENQLREIFKRNGFNIAAEMMELHRFNKAQIRRMVATWSNYPDCMNIYPEVLLVKRTYNGE